MLKKTLRLVIFLFVVNTCFFIGEKGVNAEECYWRLYNSYLDGNNKIISTSQRIVELDFSNSYFHLYYGDNTTEFSGSSSIQSDMKKSCTYENYKYLKVYISNNKYWVEPATESDLKNYYANQYNDLKYTTDDQGNKKIDNITSVTNVKKQPLIFVGDNKYSNFAHVDYSDKHLNELSTTYEEENQYYGEVVAILNTNTFMRRSEYEFFMQTKDKWLSIVNNAINEIDSSCSWDNETLFNCSAAVKYEQYSKYFYIYFNKNIARWILEDDYNQFLKCYKFAYLYGANLENSERITKISELTKMIEGLKENNVTRDEREQAKINMCNSLCGYANGTLTTVEYQNACKNNNTKYHDCLNAYSKCKNAGTGFDYCMSSVLGRDNYNELSSINSQYLKALDDKIHETNQKIIKSVSTIHRFSVKELPSLNMDFNKKYEVKCEDVKMLHSIYMALIIIGPILVVVLGTIDYAKAVIASDEKKMQENKKKFPKRLIAGVLLLLVPFIIKFLLNIFGGNLKLLKCIVNGIIMKF